jgi:Domain of unknown function (DUF4395)
MNDNLECPVDLVMVNENKVRFTAFLVLLLTVAFLLTSLWIIIVFLTIDFFLRAFKWGQYSLLSIIGDKFVSVFKIKNKPVDRAPKRFAAGIGFVITLTILLLLAFKFLITAGLVALVLIFFAFLESVLGFCAGCYVYTLGKKLFG